MNLFIANTSKSHHDFIFRRPENKQTTMMQIKAGQQVQVLKGVDKDVIDFVLDQHRKYGMISGDEAAKRHAGYTGLCYSVDKPVSEKQMRGSFENNDRVLKEVAVENFKTQAGATADSIQKQLDETGLDANLGHMEVEISQVLKPGEEAQAAPVQVEVAKAGQSRRRR